eukprot:9675426-Prorocentrum_lima.AAC.1
MGSTRWSHLAWKVLATRAAHRPSLVDARGCGQRRQQQQVAHTCPQRGLSAGAIAPPSAHGA